MTSSRRPRIASTIISRKFWRPPGRSLSKRRAARGNTTATIAVTSRIMIAVSGIHACSPSGKRNLDHPAENFATGGGPRIARSRRLTGPYRIE
jgi:hypothetical protein